MKTSPIIQQMLKSAGLMTGFILLGVGLLLGVYQLTQEDIAQAEKETLLQTFDQVLPKDRYDNDPLADTQSITSAKLLGTPNPVTFYRARKAGKPVAVIFEIIAPEGYSGNINLLIAVYHDGRIAGTRTLKHKETPGLGDKIELSKAKWILDFSGRSLRDDNVNNWAVKKDGGMFDQFTGATITPRAVVKAIKNALILVNSQGDKLYE